jgi:Plavaka transposase
MTAAGKEEAKNRSNHIYSSMMAHLLHYITDAVDGYYAQCADGKVRHCFPRLAAWIADYPEHSMLGGFSNGYCQWCEVEKDSLGANPDTMGRLPDLRDHKRYQQLFRDGSTESIAELHQRGIRPTENPLWQTGANIHDLPKPDLLHTMQLGMIKHLIEWIEMLCKAHGRLQRFDDLWLQVPAYLEMTRPTRAYSEVSQWQGKEMKTMARFLMAVVVGALNAPSGVQKRPFEDAIKCTRGLLDFWMYCQYPSHDDESLEQMDDALKRFHDSKGVFLSIRGPKAAKERARKMKSALIKERDREAAPVKGGAKKRLIDEWNQFIDSEVKRMLEEEAHFNFPKIHMMLHFHRQVQRFGVLRQWDTNTSEMAHKEQIKEGFRHSNRTGNVPLQILNHYLKQDAFAMRRLNYDPIKRFDDALYRENDPQLFSPQRTTGKNRIATVESLLNHANITGFYDALQGFVVRQDLMTDDMHNKDFFMMLPASLYHGLQVHRQKHGTGEWEALKLRCTIDGKWYSGDPRRDWVWYRAIAPNLPAEKDARRGAMEKEVTKYADLRGRLPVRLRCLFKASFPCSTQGKESQSKHLALVELTQPRDGGKLSPLTGLARVKKPTHCTGLVMGEMGEMLRVIECSYIDGPAHLIPDEVGHPLEISSWLVNTNIDLGTWNYVWKGEE